MSELSESINQLPAGDDLAALLLKRWTSGGADDAPENTSDDGSWVDVADENNDWCYLRADEVDGASDADDASAPLGDGANAVGGVAEDVGGAIGGLFGRRRLVHSNSTAARRRAQSGVDGCCVTLDFQEMGLADVLADIEAAIDGAGFRVIARRRYRLDEPAAREFLECSWGSALGDPRRRFRCARVSRAPSGGAAKRAAAFSMASRIRVRWLSDAALC